MASLLNQAFQNAKNENRPALLTYTVAGDNTYHHGGRLHACLPPNTKAKNITRSQNGSTSLPMTM